MTIFVAYDPETREQAPVRFAAAAARFAMAPLVVASVHARPPHHAEKDELMRLYDDLARDGGVQGVRPRILHSSRAADVVRQLQRAAEEEHADLVVVGSSRRGAIGRVAPGATAQRMINGCRRPVVVVPHGHDGPPRVTTIGVAFVPTPEGHLALRVAAAIARVSGASLRVLTVMKPILGADASAGSAKEDAERQRAELEDIVSTAIAELGDGVRVEREVFVDDPADALLCVSAHLDLLVMGARGYGAMLGLFLGSVSRRVTVAAECPVLVVPRASAAVPAMRRLDAAGGSHPATAPRLSDVRTQLVGGFAGAVPPSAPVGSFAGIPRRRDQGTGSFAGDPDTQRQGSFGDTDLGVRPRHEGGAVRPANDGGATLDEVARAA